MILKVWAGKYRLRDQDI